MEIGRFGMREFSWESTLEKLKNSLDGPIPLADPVECRRPPNILVLDKKLDLCGLEGAVTTYW
jgi:hypothetical protein